MADLLFTEGDTDTALTHWQSGLEAVRSDVDDTDGSLTGLRIHGHRGMGRGLTRQLRLPEALQHLAQAMALAEEAARQDPGDAALQWQFLGTADEAADTLALAHPPDIALRCSDHALEVCAAMVYANLADGALVRHIAHLHHQRALALELVGDDAGARDAATAAERYAGLLEPGADG
jgi:hypothetical protein